MKVESFYPNGLNVSSWAEEWEGRKNNDAKSVTDCFKCGLALSALPLTPENCLALFPRATHLIKHARSSRSPDLSHFPTPSRLLSPASTRSIAASTRLYTNPRLHSRSVFLSLPLLFPWSRFNTFRPVPLWSFVYYIGNRVSLSSLLSLRPSYLPQPSPSHQPGRGLASNLVLRRFSSTLRGQRSCSLFGSTMQKFPTAPATAK